MHTAALRFLRAICINNCISAENTVCMLKAVVQNHLQRGCLQLLAASCLPALLLVSLALVE